MGSPKDKAGAGLAVLAVGPVPNPIESCEAAVQFPDSAARVAGANPAQGARKGGQSIKTPPRIESDKPMNTAIKGTDSKIVRINIKPIR